MSFTTYDDLAERLASRLDVLSAPSRRAPRGDDLPLDQFRPHGSEPGASEGARAALTPAAVLAPIVRHPGQWTLLLTQRTDTMPTHAGQTALPGGRVQDEDAGPVATALRETLEEIGLAHDFITPIGRIESYATGTGYEIVPVIAYVEPGFSLRLDAREVHSAFEVPIAFLFDPSNHLRREGWYRGIKRTFYEMIYEDRRVWGATAGMIRALYERLYGEDPS